MEDLECYVDNSLKRTDGGVIVGRQSGIKGWLQMEIPALYMKYKTVMAYKAAAKRMRQVLDIRDPLPLSAALPRRGKTLGHGADEINGRGSGKRGIRGDKRLRKPGVKATLTVELSAGQMLEDVKLAIEGGKPVSFFGHLGSQFPTTDEIRGETLKIKEGK